MDELPSDIWPQISSLSQRRSLNRHVSTAAFRERVREMLWRYGAEKELMVNYLTKQHDYPVPFWVDASLYVQYYIGSDVNTVGGYETLLTLEVTVQGNLLLDSSAPVLVVNKRLPQVGRHYDDVPGKLSGARKANETFEATLDEETLKKLLWLEGDPNMAYSLKDTLMPLAIWCDDCDEQLEAEVSIELGYLDLYSLIPQDPLYADLIAEDPEAFQEELKRFILEKLEVDYNAATELTDQWLELNYQSIPDLVELEGLTIEDKYLIMREYFIQNLN